MNIAAPDIYWEDGHLKSRAFDDVYSSRADALAESRYVFLEQSGFSEAAAKLNSCVIGETGFGTGLNFLAAWQAWRAVSSGTLHFISVEKYPLATTDIQKALSCWPELSELTDCLIAQYPIRRAGVYRLYFDEGRVQLTLCFGDVEDCLKEFTSPVDFWFLDGFAPRQNESMWSASVIKDIARLSHAGTGLSTFTAVGVVRRQLQDCGFQMRKVPGFANKREMLAGTFNVDAGASLLHPCYRLPREQKAIKHIAIIGAGLAGTSCAFVANQRGISCDIYDAGGIAQAASGNALGIAGPCLSADNEAFAQYYFAAWQQALRTWTLDARFDGIVHKSGTKHYLRSEADQTRAQRLIDQCCQVDAWAQLKADKSILEIPDVLLVSPAALCHRYIALSNAQVIQQSVQEIQQQASGMWSVHTAESAQEYDAIIIANAQAALQFSCCHHLSLQSVRGQLLEFSQSISDDARIQQDDLYLTPFHNGKQVLGATFQRDDPDPNVRLADQEELMQEARQIFSVNLANSSVSGRVSFRSCGPDRLPVVGPVIDAGDFMQRFADLRHGRQWQVYDDARYLPGLLLSVGHGSRGITGSLLAAHINCACLLGEPLPIAAKTWQGIASQRFCYRQLRRA